MNEHLIDTNVLAYAFDTENAEKRAVAKNLILQSMKKGGSVTLQNLTECFAVLSRHGLSASKTMKILVGMSKKFKVHTPEISSFEYATELVYLYKIDFWDAMIAAVMLQNAILTVYTENTKDFRKIPGIMVINPFLASSAPNV